MIPIHPQDQHLLGVQWENCSYVDKRLPFGLRSAPKIFSAVADAIQFILTKKGIHNCLHYLDDYILVASSKSEAEQQKQKLCSVFNKLKVPLETSKLEGPATCLSFLGIEVDTSLRQLRLPVEKLTKLKAELAQCVFLQINHTARAAKPDRPASIRYKNNSPRQTTLAAIVHTARYWFSSRPLHMTESSS